MSAEINLNRVNLSGHELNVQINNLIESAEPPSKNWREYLGASAIGSECPRKVQYDWMCDPVFPGRIKDIFQRGHFFEEVTRQHLIAAGFKFALKSQLEFKVAEGSFRGHAMASSSTDHGCLGCSFRVCGNTSASRTKAGARSSVTV